MPFGLKNAITTYQRLVNNIFSILIGETVKAYVDDMVVKRKSITDHPANLAKVFKVPREYKMMLNPEKCTVGFISGRLISWIHGDTKRNRIQSPKGTSNPQHATPLNKK